MFVDSIFAAIQENQDMVFYLRYMGENSEVMVQRDPEIMKQKQLGNNAQTDVAGSSTSRKQ